MLYAEARWFAARLAELGDNAAPLCHAGSGSARMRREVQPWIDQLVFAPLRAAGRKVVHVDLEAADGVDIAGDLSSPALAERLAGEGFRGVICANLLEHVTDPAVVAANVRKFLAPGGYLLASVPRSFPYHPDPIDTLFRPTPEELAALFPRTRLVQGAILRCGNLTTYLARRAFRPVTLAQSLLRGAATGTTTTPSAGPRPSPWRYLPWLWRTFEITCVLLQAEGEF